VDLERGGNNCGVLQLSVVACDPAETKVIGEFNEHIRPPASAFWCDKASAVHGICQNDVRMTSASGIKEVWKRFVDFIEGHLANGSKKGIIAAWGGLSCDCEWLFRITKDTHHGALLMPRWCPLFMDPKKVVSHHTSCEPNTKHSAVLGHGCEEMWCFVTGDNCLLEARSAMADAKAQCAIAADSRFMNFIDKPVAMMAMVDVWAAKKKARDLRSAELKRKVPTGWIEGEDNSAAWKSSNVTSRVVVVMGPH